MTIARLFPHLLRAGVALGLLATAAFVAGPAKACAFCDTYRVVNVDETDVLYMRSGPSRHHRIVGAIPHDGYGVIKAGGCRGNWCLMEHYGKSGWVNMRYLRYIQ
ncbi:MAG: SH3 domain-containing protein [Hyphomicrobiaceae bacterium]